MVYYYFYAGTSMRYQYFNYIRKYFGENTCYVLKKFMKLTVLEIKIKSRIMFIKRCIRMEIIPPHLKYVFNKVKCYQYCNNEKLNKINLNYIKIVLKLELKDAYKQLHYKLREIFKLYNKIVHQLPVYISNEFFRRQDVRIFHCYNTQCDRINKKIDHLREKQVKDSQRFKIIEYYYDDSNVSIVRSSQITNSIDNNNNVKEKHYWFGSPENNGIDNNKIHILLSPLGFNQNKFSIFNVQDKWFKDYTNTQIPLEVKLLLQLGERFSVPISNKLMDKTLIEFIKNIERNIEKLMEDIKLEIRNGSVSILKDFYRTAHPATEIEKTVRHWLKITIQFMKDNPDVIFTRADKGNITVALNKSEYFLKMNLLLSDHDTYELVDKDPIKKVTNSLKNHLLRWKNKQYIDKKTYSRLLTTDGILPRAYGVPKVHKPHCPYRIIVSCTNSPLYNLALYLHKIIEKCMLDTSKSVKNSFELVDMLSHISLREDYQLVSLDVISLFTNIPIDYAINCITEMWDKITDLTDFSHDEFICAIGFVLHSTFFSFDNKIYKQTFGTPMGSPLSPIIADLTLRNLENKALNSLLFNPPIYIRYVDDILMAIPIGKIHETVELFNSYHERLQFTVEMAVDNSINYLDVRLTMEDNKITMDWYQKESSSGRYLNFYSLHPITQKRGVIMGLVDRVIRLSHPRFHQKNFVNVINILINNGYPLEFIFDSIIERLKYHFHKNSSEKNRNNSTEMKMFFNVPFVGPLSEKFVPLMKKFNMRIAYSRCGDLSNFIRMHKDKIDKLTHNNVVYQILCGDCDVSYVGQTMRQLKTRMNEHKSDVRKGAQSSVIAHHTLEHDHGFDWNNIKILDEESSYSKRLTSEMISIKRQKNGINKQSDTDLLSDVYFPILNLLPKV